MTIKHVTTQSKFRVSAGHVKSRGLFLFVYLSDKSSQRSNHENIFSKTFA